MKKRFGQGGNFRTSGRAVRGLENVGIQSAGNGGDAAGAEETGDGVEGVTLRLQGGNNGFQGFHGVDIVQGIVQEEELAVPGAGKNPAGPFLRRDSRNPVLTAEAADEEEGNGVKEGLADGDEGRTEKGGVPGLRLLCNLTIFYE